MNACDTAISFQGKSLSVICSALQWLKDAEAKQVDGNSSSKPSATNGGCDYMHTSHASSPFPYSLIEISPKHHDHDHDYHHHYNHHILL